MRDGRWSRLVFVVMVVVLAACDWTQSRFDGAHTSFNPSEPALTTSSVRQLTEAWSANAGAGVVANGVVYASSLGGPDTPTTAEAFKVTSGATVWTATLAGHAGPAAVGNGLVYYSGSDSTGARMFALDAQTGVQRWSVPAAVVAMDRMRLFAIDDSSSILAIDSSGTIVWKVDSAGPFTSAVVQGGQLVVVTSIRIDNPPHGIILVSTYDETNGVLLRTVSVPAQDANGNVTLPIGEGSLPAGPKLIYFVTGFDDVFAADPTNGTVAWHANLHFIGGVAVTPSAVVVSMQGRVIAIKPDTGALLWATVPVAGSLGEPVVAGNLVFVDDPNGSPPVGELIYDLSNGALVANNTTICCTPIVAEGHIFINGLHAALQAMVPAS